MNKKYKIILFVLISLIVICSFIIPYTSSKYIETKNQSFLLNIFEPEYKIIFNANTGTGSMSPEIFTYSESKSLTQNSFTKDAYAFDKWTTNPNGTGTSYQDKEVVTKLSETDGDEITLYAQWVPAIARVGTEIFDSLQAAINSVTTSDETTVELLTNVTENLTISSTQNIILDLKNNTVNATSGTLLTNSGTCKIINGTLTSSSTQTATINNNSTGHLIITGGEIYMTANAGKQAIYNNGGILEISGTAYISSQSGSGNNARATVHNLASGTTIITGGTIVSPRYQAVYNESGTLTIGVKDGNIDITTPVIQGATIGVNNKVAFSFYNGIIKGKNNAINDETKIIEIEDDAQLLHGTESIGGQNYKTAFLGISYLVTFDPNGGTVIEPTRNVPKNEPVGSLPTPQYGGHRFLGWFRALDGNDQINESEIITEDVTFYAHWEETMVAEINGVRYPTIAAAIATVPNNTQTTIDIIDDCYEEFEIPARKNIVLNIGTYSLHSPNNTTIINNFGTLVINGGIIESNGGDATINNKNNCNMTINGSTVIATGIKQALYNEKGTVLITGDSYFSSSASGSYNNSTVERGTIQNVGNGKMTIESGSIVNSVQSGISNEGTLTLGVGGDSNIDTNIPNVRGETYGLTTNGTVKFYDGILKGYNGSVDGTITEIETNSHEVDSTETIDGKQYYTKHIEEN